MCLLIVVIIDHVIYKPVFAGLLVGKSISGVRAVSPGIGWIYAADGLRIEFGYNVIDNFVQHRLHFFTNGNINAIERRIVIEIVEQVFSIITAKLSTIYF